MKMKIYLSTVTTVDKVKGMNKTAAEICNYIFAVNEEHRSVQEMALTVDKARSG